MSELENTGSNPTPTNDRVESRRILDKMSVGNRFRLMFGQPLLPEECSKFGSILGAVSSALRNHMMEKCNDITEEVLANCVTQALLCGDFQLQIAYGPNMTEGQSATYMPARQVAGLKGQPEEATRNPEPDEVWQWMQRNGWQGSQAAATVAIVDARTLHNAP